MTVVGTRPEIIRLSRVIARLDDEVEHVLVHTGQNYDYELNQVFFDQLQLRPPDHYLSVDTSSLGTVLGGTLIGTERVLREVRPDAVLVLGDTNSCLAAIMARRMRVPVFHMEAGNRCFDLNVPEETNRRLVDHVSDFNLVYTEHARRNLLREGLEPRKICLTGSPMREVIDHYGEAIQSSDATRRMGLAPGEFLLVSAHREENVDDLERLHALVETLKGAHADLGMPVLVSTHPRTRARLEEAGVPAVDGVEYSPPLGFPDYCRLQTDAACVLSDSGTISEESLMLGFPAVTLRESIERPEALDTAGIIMAGVEKDRVLEAVRTTMRQWGKGERPEVPPEYRIENTSQRVLNFLLSTVHAISAWDGLRRGPAV